MSEVITILGAKSYLALVDESVWNEFPGAPVYVHCPVNDYGPKFVPVTRQGQSFIGLRQRKQNRFVKGSVAGTVTTPLYGWRPGALGTSLAQHLMDWGFGNHEATNLPSKSADWAIGPNIANRRHTGLRVNQGTLTGSEDQGILLALDLMGADELPLAAAQALPDTRNKLIEFEFEDCVFKIDDTPVPIGAFQWQVQNNLNGFYWNAKRFQALRPGDRIETFTITPPKQTNAWQTALRANLPDEVVGELTLKGLHNGTGTALTDWNQVVIDFPRLSLTGVDEQGGRDILTEPITWAVLKPDTAANGSAMTWSDEA